eukprot:TRINITY_DN803_c0_g1_i1.p2 TRINITY_DN803_c0_g1~~TRINITY_DN803_c0_g1_i1.p2  ORF type:complete len:300 (-),score=91.28 TRINITY_DN803_c0_g1_i1:322-1221(-)
MGLCFSTSENDRKENNQSSKIEKELETSKNKEKKVLKILLLGTGESGKSTIFKQMQILYQGGFNPMIRENFKNVVHKNVLESMQALIRVCDEKFHLVLETPEEQKAAQYIVSIENISADNASKVAPAIEILWKSKNIRHAYARRNEFYVIDSAEYYFDRVNSVMSDDYMPDDMDILRARLRTSGITENMFMIDGVGFQFIDVGGQRNERRKWIHCFAGVTTILFIAAINEFDQMLYEDEKQNRMLEALEVFQGIVNNPFFEETPLILFLNKRDLLEEKIKNGVHPGVCFPDYTGKDLLL